MLYGGADWITLTRVIRAFYRRSVADPWAALVVVAAIVLGVLTIVAAHYADPAVKVSRSQQARFYSQAARAAEANPDSRLVSVWVGDSYTSGSGAASPYETWPALTAYAMNWIFTVDGEGGSGFINDGHSNDLAFQPLAGRFAQTAEENLADVVLVDAGRNDPDTRATVSAARKYLNRVHRAWPQAKVVLIAPYYLTQDVKVNPSLREFYKARAKRSDTYLIDPVAEGWATSHTKRLLISDGIHPNPKGHKYIAEHLVADLKSRHLSP